MRITNILDEIHPSLPPRVWSQPTSPSPSLHSNIATFILRHIYNVLEGGGYTNPHQWLHLYFTGSLCTYQYSDTSDADISLFVQTAKLPEWSRAEMIGLMVEGCDGVTLPDTPYELQAYVMPSGIEPHQQFKPGLRAGYSIDTGRWIAPPDRDLAHDVQSQENGFYMEGLQAADKMERMLRYEPDKAQDYWHQIHRRRMRDQKMGKGDFSESNIIYKFISQRGLAPQLEKQEHERMTHAQFRSHHQLGRRGKLAAGHPVITPEMLSSPTAIERGLSRPVSEDEFRRLWAEGARRYQAMINSSRLPQGLEQNWPGLINHAYQETRTPWGGVTLDSHTGQPIRSDADVYALTVKEPGMRTISVPAKANSEQFAATMNNAKYAFAPILSRANHHLGIFHDADLGQIDFDPTVIVDNPEDVETIGAYTNAVGGAYHFASGNGYWPPHVAQPQQQPQEQQPIAA